MLLSRVIRAGGANGALRPDLRTPDFCLPALVLINSSAGRNRPSERETWPANNLSVLRYAPLWKVAMETAPTKEAPKKAALKNDWPQRGHFQFANHAARKK